MVRFAVADKQTQEQESRLPLTGGLTQSQQDQSSGAWLIILTAVNSMCIFLFAAIYLRKSRIAGRSSSRQINPLTDSIASTSAHCCPRIAKDGTRALFGRDESEKRSCS